MFASPHHWVELMHLPDNDCHDTCHFSPLVGSTPTFQILGQAQTILTEYILSNVVFLVVCLFACKVRYIIWFFSCPECFWKLLQFMIKTRMTTIIETKLKKFDNQTNIDNYRVAVNNTEYQILSKLIFLSIIILKCMMIKQLYHIKYQKSTCLK